MGERFPEKKYLDSIKYMLMGMYPPTCFAKHLETEFLN